MVDPSLYAAFVVAAFALCITPGPDMMFVVAVGGRGGPSAGVMAAAGIALGVLVHVAAVMLGLSALFTAVPVLYHVLRWVGAAYLLYLAVMAFRDRSGFSVDEEQSAAADPGLFRAFWQGTITNLFNPKIILFNIAFLPQFVNPSAGHVAPQLLTLGLTLVVMGFVLDATIGLLSGRLAATLRRSRRVARGLNIFSGTVFAGLAIRLVAVP